MRKESQHRGYGRGDSLLTASSTHAAAIQPEYNSAVETSRLAVLRISNAIIIVGVRGPG